MPQLETTTPAAGQPIDRLTLAVSEARGAEAATTGACGSGCALCFCVDADA